MPDWWGQIVTVGGPVAGLLAFAIMWMNRKLDAAQALLAAAHAAQLEDRDEQIKLLRAEVVEVKGDLRNLMQSEISLGNKRAQSTDVLATVLGRLADKLEDRP